MVRFLVAGLLLPGLFSSLQAEEVITFAGTGKKGFSGDGGPASKAELNNPFAIARGPDGALYLCDVDNQRVRKITKDGIISTVAGNGKKAYSGDGGPATEASLNQPYELAWDADQNLYFVEIGNHVVRKVEARSGKISTLAGTGQKGFSGDNGPANKATMSQPHSLAIDPEGNLLVCDIGNHRVRKIDMKTGIISTWAGNGEKKTSPDGAKIAGSSLNGPRALAFAPDGKLWLALREGNMVLQLDPKAGTIRHVAGTGKSGFTGNGGPALQATLSGPKGVSLDPQGNVYLADTESHTIRMIDVKKNSIELIVGDGKKGDGPDGVPMKCQLARPHGIFVDRDGTIYIGDSENHRVRMLRR
jgi:sugar lactone lactonase YvrE